MPVRPQENHENLPNFSFFGGFWSARRCLLSDVCLWRMLQKLFSSFVFTVAFSFALPWRHSLERILTFHSFLALFAFSFSPESCVLLVVVPCCITFSFWPRTEAGSWTFAFLSIALRFTFLERSAVQSALRVWTLRAQNPEIGFCEKTCKSFFSCFPINDPKPLFSFLNFTFVNDEKGRPFSVRNVWISDPSLETQNSSRKSCFTCKYVYCGTAICRMFIDETKPSRCCSSRSDCTKTINDIKLSDNGNAFWCCARRFVIVCSRRVTW